MKNILQSKFTRNIGSAIILFIGFIAYTNYVDDNSTETTFNNMYVNNNFDKDMVVITPLYETNAAGDNVDSNKSYIEIEIADNAYDRGVGLMFRKELSENDGMLFIFQDDSNVAFWMKNTLIPLDIIYISEDLKIVSISEEAQPCKIEVCPTYPSDDIYRYALEVNGGYVESHNIEVGDSIEIFEPVSTIEN